MEKILAILPYIAAFLAMVDVVLHAFVLHRQSCEKKLLKCLSEDIKFVDSSSVSVQVDDIDPDDISPANAVKLTDDEVNLLLSIVKRYTER